MMITITVGILMLFVGYIFGKARGQRLGAIKMGYIVSKSIAADPQKAVDVIKKQYNLD